MKRSFCPFLSLRRTSMALEYSAKKKKEVPDLNLYYEMCQSLADAIGLIKKQCFLL